MRLKSLPSLDISIHVTSVTVFSSSYEEKFITELRDKDGKVDRSKMMAAFGKWVFNQGSLNKFDVAVLVLRKGLKDYATGIAYQAGACKKDEAVAVIQDDGGYTGINTLAHELGHL